MRNKKTLAFFKSLLCLITLLIALSSATPASAAANASVSVSAPSGTVAAGEQFTVTISVTPNNAIAGMQFNLAFNPAVATAVSVTEGNLLDKNGDSTYFSAGSINNQAGTITGVFGAIIDPGQDVSAAGNFAVITMTAASGGTSPLTLSNVVVGDVACQSVPADITSGTVTVEQSGDDTPAAPAPGGGGVAGGGGGGSGAAGITPLRPSSAADGRTFEEVTAFDIDMQLLLVIPKGTLVLNPNGQPANSIRIIPMGDTLAADPGSTAVSQSFEIKESGTTFEGPATLMFRYYSLPLPAGIPATNFYIAQWDPTAGSWIDLGGTLDPNACTVSVPIDHLSSYAYALMAHSRPASFAISGLTLAPAEVIPGGIISASAMVSNRGDLPGTCEVSFALDSAQLQTKEVSLDGGGEATVSFSLNPDAVGEHQVTVGDMTATFRVVSPPAGAAFALDSININPLQANPGDTVAISAVVRNTGEQPGSYHAVLTLDDVEAGSSDVTLNGGESQEISFNIVADTAGLHKASIGGLVAPFEVKAPPPPTPEAVPAATDLALADFNAAPGYDNTNSLAFVTITFEMNQDWAPFTDDKLMLTVFHNGQFLEQVPLLAVSQQQPDGKSGQFSYVPAAGWKAGAYAFRAELYQGDNLVQDTPLRTLTGAPGSTAVVSWKILGIIIGAALGIGVLVVGLVLYFRRDMLRDYWK